jgi:hypothetical protein
VSRDYINDPAEDAAFSLRAIRDSVDDLVGFFTTSRDIKEIKEAAIEVIGMLEARIPQRGEPDDIGFDDEHEAIERLAALLDAV